MPSLDELVHVEGACYCGAITFSVDVPVGETPIFTAYCHCDSCRRAHAAPLYHVVCVSESWFTLTAGEPQLNEFQKPGGAIVRAFCSTCGSRILNRFPGWTPQGQTPLAFFPDLLRAEDRVALPEMFRPQKHNQPDECVLDQERLESVFNAT